MIEVACPSEADTLALAGRLAALARPGDVIALSGQLGAGKTLFVGGLAEGLGVEEQVSSPSFVLMREYRSGFLPLIHADVYRLSSLNEFADLELLEEARDGVLIIEWGDAVESWLPPDHLRVDFHVEDDGCRNIRIRPAGNWATRSLEGLVA